jgi:hypothetical protein
MKRKSIGYFEGTDSAVLTSLICDGHDTLPISNGMDNHGMHVRLINEETKVDVLMGYLHKIYAPLHEKTMAKDMFHVCQIYEIPFLVIVPKELHDSAGKKLEGMPPVVRFVDPANLLAAAREILGH